MITYRRRDATHVMVNFRATPTERQELQQLVERLTPFGRDARYHTRGYAVSVSDVIRWGLEALRRELDATQAAAEAAEYNAKHPARKPSPATAAATRSTRSKAKK